jgi:DNA-binding NarL/FixJ family response regulator
MLRDIVGDAIARQPDMELVASGEPTELATTIAQQQPDAVILAEEGPGLNVARAELFGVGRLRILVVTGAGREAHWVELQQIAVSEVSPQGLVETIRSRCS